MKEATQQYNKFSRIRRYGSHTMKVTASRVAYLPALDALAVIAEAKKKREWTGRYTAHMVRKGFQASLSRELANADYDAAGEDRADSSPEEWADESIYAMVS
ncbi:MULTISPECIES: hypothetical protein [Herbaspirillum]|uniref:Uncharacterized protein n=2 Tax=Herbaspirillum huttiense TaxID=863372 RepID=A0AAJ2LVV6_9BURK|nr:MULTISPECIES: hypothetical protein [Herbaspirillum]MDR9836898.1 hypothetical protein [Herbaspirillum huttiense]